MSKMKWKRNTLQKFLEEIGSENRSYNSPWKKKKEGEYKTYFKSFKISKKLKKKKEVEMQRLREYSMSQENKSRIKLF